jgi:hypothetical protein
MGGVIMLINLCAEVNCEVEFMVESLVRTSSSFAADHNIK